MYRLSFLKVTLDFSISALNSLPLFFLLANKRSGMSGGNGGYQFKNTKMFYYYYTPLLVPYNSLLVTQKMVVNRPL